MRQIPGIPPRAFYVSNLIASETQHWARADPLRRSTANRLRVVQLAESQTPNREQPRDSFIFLELLLPGRLRSIVTKSARHMAIFSGTFTSGSSSCNGTLLYRHTSCSCQRISDSVEVVNGRLSCRICLIFYSDRPHCSTSDTHLVARCSTSSVKPLVGKGGEAPSMENMDGTRPPVGMSAAPCSSHTETKLADWRGGAGNVRDSTTYSLRYAMSSLTLTRVHAQPRRLVPPCENGDFRIGRSKGLAPMRLIWPS
ncbi:hypothetical protein J6590_007841 [Homalodisca vitripennis]|nr:hypothetical protein J6590_007841 [Homalodisca vitripennis]